MTVQRQCVDCGAPISDISRGRCVRCGHRPMVRKCPEDFLAILATTGSRLAAAHYRASLKTITRWRREHGLAPNYRARRGSSTGRLNRSRFTMAPKALLVHRDFTMPGRAADYLQRFGPVYRCLTTGKAHPKGTYWNRNGYVLTDAQLIDRALRLGWKEPDAF
jgi:DNA-directed RNA polymerase subunit RPC12/RpoP